MACGYIQLNCCPIAAQLLPGILPEAVPVPRYYISLWAPVQSCMKPTTTTKKPPVLLISLLFIACFQAATAGRPVDAISSLFGSERSSGFSDIYNSLRHSTKSTSVEYCLENGREQQQE